MKPVTEESGDPSVRIRFLFSEAVFVSEKGKLDIAIGAARWAKLLVVSKQIYANHYFDASLTVTAFGRNPNANGDLFYENRSRVDGLNGLFGKLERGVIEGQGGR